METSELILAIISGAFLLFVCLRARKKRSEITSKCPKCGATCNASPSGTGLRNGRGEYVHRFKCPNCGNDYML